jgi:hypothetical protein
MGKLPVPLDCSPSSKQVPGLSQNMLTGMQQT